MSKNELYCYLFILVRLDKVVWNMLRLSKQCKLTKNIMKNNFRFHFSDYI